MFVITDRIKILKKTSIIPRPYLMYTMKTFIWDLSEESRQMDGWRYKTNFQILSPLEDNYASFYSLPMYKIVVCNFFVNYFSS